MVTLGLVRTPVVKMSYNRVGENQGSESDVSDNSIGENQGSEK